MAHAEMNQTEGEARANVNPVNIDQEAQLGGLSSEAGKRDTATIYGTIQGV
jgi:hypothetical protein